MNLGFIRGETGTGSTRVLRNTLVVVEVALALQLIVGATLMVDTFRRIGLSDPGFRTTDVLTLGITLPEKDYPSDSVVRNYFENLETRVAALPGVGAAAPAMARRSPVGGRRPPASPMTQRTASTT